MCFGRLRDQESFLSRSHGDNTSSSKLKGGLAERSTESLVSGKTVSCLSPCRFNPFIIMIRHSRLHVLFDGVNTSRASNRKMTSIAEPVNANLIMTRCGSVGGVAAALFAEQDPLEKKREVAACVLANADVNVACGLVGGSQDVLDEGKGPICP